MSDGAKVNVVIGSTAAEALGKLRAATERETIPFVSASRYPQQREKEFVASISGSRFRIWKVPSSSRSRQKVCIPYLHGDVKDVAQGSNLSGRFALHPFSIVLTLFPLAVLLPLWMWADKTSKSLTLLIPVSVLFLLADVILIGAIKRFRPREEEDILAFLLKLFPEGSPPR